MNDLAPPAQVTGLAVPISGGQTEGDRFQLLAVVPADVTTYLDPTSGCGQIYYLTSFNPAGESHASTSSYYSPACRP